MNPLVTRSEELHEKVRALEDPQDAAAFEALALELAEFQASFSPGFARLVRARGSRLDSLESIPAVPTDAFRLTRVAVHPPELDVAAFITSGTTASARGTHYFRSLATYRHVALRFGRRALVSDREGRRTVACLAPPLGEAPRSSLGFMMRLFHEAWDGRDERWLVREDRVDVDELERAITAAHARAEPLVLLATAFALVALLEALGRRRLEAPAGSVVMMTGGFKGRVHEVDGETLREATALALGIATERVLGEYGMTELTSQLYEGTLPGGELSAETGIFLEPPTLRVVPVDPVTLEPTKHGGVGIAKIIDLGNVDSAVAVQTQDRVRRRGGGIELLGRAPGAPPRGCSLALEALLA